MTTATALQFTYAPELWPDSPPSRHWFAGRYKITAYDAIDHGDYMRRESFRAYYKPIGWKNWGMGVERGSPAYRTLDEAKAACMRHAEIGDYTYKG
jgi:hypothetical protein